MLRRLFLSSAAALFLFLGGPRAQAQEQAPPVGPREGGQGEVRVAQWRGYNPGRTYAQPFRHYPRQGFYNRPGNFGYRNYSYNWYRPYYYNQPYYYGSYYYGMPRYYYQPYRYYGGFSVQTPYFSFGF